MSEEIQNIEKKILYKDAAERDVVKQYFTNPKEIDRTKRTIVFSTPSETGTSYFRLFEPMKALWKKHRDEINIIYTENIQPNHFQLADCVVMHRCGNLHSHFVSVARLWPKTEKRPLIIHDVDDNEFNLPATHPMRDLWITSGKDKMSIQSLKHSDIVTTTTEKLYLTFKTFNKNVSIIPNMFDWDLPQWNLDKEQVRRELIPEWGKDKIIVGWAGLTSHYEDIRRMHAILKQIHDKHPETVFILAGMALKDSQVEIEYKDGKPVFREKEIEDENQRYRGRVKNLYSDFEPSRIKLFDAVPLEEYGKFYALFDISLAYLERNAFNSCKSQIKVVESLHYGCIPIFSDFGGYHDLISALPKELRYEHMALYATAPGIWVRAIEHWIDEFKKGNSLDRISKLKEASDNLYDINLHIDERLSFYLENIEQHDEKQINNISRFVDYDGV
jgi:glycosyltransferase involved in cell wall biosynthesis